MDTPVTYHSTTFVPPSGQIAAAPAPQASMEDILQDGALPDARLAMPLQVLEPAQPRVPSPTAVMRRVFVSVVQTVLPLSRGH